MDKLPLRVLVKGASLGHEVSKFPPDREDFVFPRVLEGELLAAGVPAQVWNAAVASEMSHMAFRPWEEQVKAWGPDVIVLTYGYYECVHLILPRWLERHANSLKARPGSIRTRYRRFLLRPVWKALAVTQQWLDRRVLARGFERRARQVRRDLQVFIDTSRKRSGKPLVVLFEFFVPPGKRGQEWFPGMGPRAAIVNREIRDLVASYDSGDVRLLRVPSLVEGRLAPGEEPAPDGFHYSPKVHRWIGEALAGEVLDWLQGHPDLLLTRRPAPVDDAPSAAG